MSNVVFEIGEFKNECSVLLREYYDVTKRDVAVDVAFVVDECYSMEQVLHHLYAIGPSRPLHSVEKRAKTVRKGIKRSKKG